MRFDRRHRVVLAAALAGALCAGTVSAHVRKSREPRPLREPQPTLVAPWDDLEKLLEDIRKVAPMLEPVSPPADHAAADGDVLLYLFVEIEPSVPASSPACEPPPPRPEP